MSADFTSLNMQMQVKFKSFGKKAIFFVNYYNFGAFLTQSCCMASEDYTSHDLLYLFMEL